MTLRIPNEGEDQLLGMQLGKYAMEVFSLRLFTNNITPGETDTSTTYTEASGNGYPAGGINLTAASWTITAGTPTEAAYPQQTFTFTGALGNVYGYFVKGNTSGKVLWAERFTDGPYNVTSSGDAIKVTIKYTKQDTLD